MKQKIFIFLMLHGIYLSWLSAYEVIINKTDAMFDNRTGLIWHDTDAYAYENSLWESNLMNWDDAMDFCLNLTGSQDWRLPSKEELVNIFKSKNLKNYKSAYYWSSSVDSENPNSAWRVHAGYGYVYNPKKSDENYVRCVRASNATSLDSLVSFLIEQKLQNILKPPKTLKLEKDEFETKKEFDSRVKKAQEEHKIAVEKYKKEYISTIGTEKPKAIKKALEMTWGKPLISELKYDAENGYFIANMSFEVKKEFQKNVAIKVHRKKARSFKKRFKSLVPQAIFDYDGKSITLIDIRIPDYDEIYIAQFTDMKITDTRVAVKLDNDFKVDSSLDINIIAAENNIATFDASKLKSFNDLDKLLANAQQAIADKTKWLFLVGIEQYEYTDNISYAKRSAEMFTKTVQKVLGVPKVNSYIMINSKASQANIKTNLKKLLKRVKKGDTIYFYYNGHGIPVPSQKNEPYLLASNTEPDFIQDEKFFSLQNIYSTLSDSNAGKIVAVVDSCFSGITDGKAILKGVAATRVIAKRTNFNQEKMVVISAGKGHQYSNAYNRKGHRLFSFYIIKNMLEGDRDIRTLYKDTKAQTYETSLEEYGDLRVQEPTIEGNARMGL